MQCTLLMSVSWLRAMEMKVSMWWLPACLWKDFTYTSSPLTFWLLYSLFAFNGILYYISDSWILWCSSFSFWLFSTMYSRCTRRMWAFELAIYRVWHNIALGFCDFSETTCSFNAILHICSMFQSMFSCWVNVYNFLLKFWENNNFQGYFFAAFCEFVHSFACSFTSFFYFVFVQYQCRWLPGETYLRNDLTLVSKLY